MKGMVSPRTLMSHDTRLQAIAERKEEAITDGKKVCTAPQKCPKFIAWFRSLSPLALNGERALPRTLRFRRSTFERFAGCCWHGRWTRNSPVFIAVVRFTAAFF